MVQARKTAIIAVGMALGACIGRNVGVAGPRVEPFGSWRLDQAATDSMRGGPDRNQDRIGIGVGRVPGSLGGNSGVIGVQDMIAEMRYVAAAWKRSTTTITLENVAAGLRVKYGESAPLRLPTDGRKVKHTMGELDDIVSKAAWSRVGLIIEHRIGRVTIKETYLRAAGARRLVVDTRIMGGAPRPIEFRRVYQPMGN